MVNTRSKIKRTQLIFKTYNSQSSSEDSDNQSSESGAVVGSNDNLLTEILLRLPAISILRFKSVSKHWRHLLNNKTFTARYGSLLKVTGFFIRYLYVTFDVKKESISSYHSLDFCFDKYGLKVVQSCNGLLLCRSDTCLADIVARKYYVINQTTRQFAVIPTLPGGGRYGRERIAFMGLAFHQTDCVHYKIVCIRYLKPVGNAQIQMYSSETRKWKICIKSFHVNSSSLFRKGVYWNGAIHWAPTYRNHLYFDVVSERLRRCPSPKDMSLTETKTLYFGESRGHLHLIVIGRIEDCSWKTSSALSVYEMLNDRSGWFVKYQVELHELMDALPEMIYMSRYFYDVLDVVRGKEEEDTFLVLRIPRKVITYNVYDKSFNHICTEHVYENEHDKYLKDGYLDFYRHTETLTFL